MLTQPDESSDKERPSGYSSAYIKEAQWLNCKVGLIWDSPSQPFSQLIQDSSSLPPPL